MRSIIPSVVIPCLVVSLAAPPCVLEFVLDGQRYEVDVSGYDRSAEETAGRLVQKLNLTGARAGGAGCDSLACVRARFAHLVFAARARGCGAAAAARRGEALHTLVWNRVPRTGSNALFNALFEGFFNATDARPMAIVNAENTIGQISARARAALEERNALDIELYARIVARFDALVARWLPS